MGTCEIGKKKKEEENKWDIIVVGIPFVYLNQVQF